jgi:hypothetical protein
MGDRANFGFAANGNAIMLYGHWAGEGMLDTLAKALEHSEARWMDSGYATRMAVSYIVDRAGATMSETGYGLYVNTLADNEHSVPVVDWDDETVSLYPVGTNHPYIRGLDKTPKFTMDIPSFINKFRK